MLKQITQLILSVIAMILAIDFLGFVAWILSGQSPAGDMYYLGSITASILRAIL